MEVAENGEDRNYLQDVLVGLFLISAGGFASLPADPYVDSSLASCSATYCRLIAEGVTYGSISLHGPQRPRPLCLTSYAP